MTNTRITYKRHPERNIWFSKQFQAGNKIVNATIINREGDGNFQVIIHDLNAGIILYEQLTQTMTAAKRVVKNKFKEVGVTLLDEIRGKKVE